MDWAVRVGIVLMLATVAVAIPAAGSASPQAPKASKAAYLSLAQQGVSDVRQHWWNASEGWYNDTYNGAPPSMPLARLWSAYPYFETLVGIEIAQPTAANKAALTAFADKAASLYWNPNIKPYGGYGYYPGMSSSQANVYYDDSGWWGLSFIDAYQASHNPVYLADARKAMRFIVGSGWDSKLGGGTWWDTFHHHKTIEPLAAAVMIGTRLYTLDNDKWALGWAQKLLTWANAHSFNQKAGLYQRSATDSTVMDYVQGLMVTANWELCKALKKPAMCTKAQQVASASLSQFGQNLDWAPMYDVVYLQWMLEYYKQSGDARFYNLAAHNAVRAQQNALNESGYYLNNWNGKPLADGLGEEASNLELFAWLAASPPPS
ncbi:MAG TPA: glycoside hydrolase family 76 protein [Gaiellaceae bacterium]